MRFSQIENNATQSAEIGMKLMTLPCKKEHRYWWIKQVGILKH